jgi:glycosyltransferase involved in cell wall biosynthesis
MGMKCLVVTSVDGMITDFLIPHIRLLENIGYEVTICTQFTGHEEKVKQSLPKTKLYQIPFSRSVFRLDNFRAYKWLKKHMKEENYDLVHVHNPIPAFLTRLAAPKDQTLLYTAHGLHFHEHGSKLSNFIFYKAEKINVNKTTGIIVMNPDDYRNVQKLFPDEKIHYVKGVGVDCIWYDPSRFTKEEKMDLRKELGITVDKKIITHVAEVNENKRQIDTVLAAEELKKSRDDFIVLLVGQGPLSDEIKEEINQRSLQDYVRVLGFRQDVDKLLSITDIGLLLSLREGLPRSVMEMMSMEIPVIGTNIRGTRDLIRKEENGYLVAPKEPKEVAQKMQDLLQNDVKRKQMGKRARDIIEREYDIHVILEHMRKIYENSKNGMYPNV